MLSDSEKRQIEHDAAAYPERRALGVDALLIVQRERGWISDEALRDVADYLAISADALEGVATFYNLIHRRPVGRHVIRLCDSVSCWLCGYREIRAALCRQLGIDFGQTSADGRYTLLPNVCLGRCEYAPVMMIDYDAHDGLSADGLAAILARYP